MINAIDINFFFRYTRDPFVECPEYDIKLLN